MRRVRAFAKRKQRERVQWRRVLTKNRNQVPRPERGTIAQTMRRKGRKRARSVGPKAIA